MKAQVSEGAIVKLVTFLLEVYMSNRFGSFYISEGVSRRAEAPNALTRATLQGVAIELLVSN